MMNYFLISVSGINYNKFRAGCSGKKNTLTLRLPVILQDKFWTSSMTDVKHNIYCYSEFYISIRSDVKLPQRDLHISSVPL